LPVTMLLALMCIFFMAKDIENSFMYLLASCISSSENCLFNLFAHLLIGLFVLLLFNFLNSIYSGYQSFIHWITGEDFLHSVGCLLILAIVSFDLQKFLNLIQRHLYFLALIS
jgi:hypothetical protein